MTPGEQALALLSHLLVDPESDAIQRGIIRGTMSVFDRAALVARGDESLSPWQVLTDPGVAPLWALPYAALWTGGTLPPRRPGETDAVYLERARYAVIYPRGMRRGSAAVVQATVDEYVEPGTASLIREFYLGDPWRVAVVVGASDAIDPRALRLAIEEVLQAGVRLELLFSNQRSWAEVAAIWRSWREVRDANPTWRDVMQA